MEINYKHVLVAGIGISGIGAAVLLNKKGIRVTFYDGNEQADLEGFYKKLPEGFRPKVILGELSKEHLKETDFMVISPGIPTDAPFTEVVREAGVPIIGEIELAYLYAQGEIAAITGTNGKTTTTTLVGEILKAYYKEVFVVGNIGMSYADVALDTTKETKIAAELSSFQLETIEEFHPKVSAVLNVTPDHLNRHYTMENYAKAKLNIAKNQTEDDIILLNYDDEITREMKKEVAARVVYFSYKETLKEGIFLQENAIVYKEKDEVKILCPLKDIKLLGIHNVENIMAAAGIALHMGVTEHVIHQVIKDFMGVEHRIEYVATKKGICYYNDSKGTNPDAAIKAIEAMIRPTVLIAGGYDKKVAFDDFVKSFGEKITHLILLGQTREQIAKAARESGYDKITMVDSLEEAVNLSAALVKPEGAVLLSPACASWGMFSNYEERGRMFKEYVYLLEE